MQTYSYDYYSTNPKKIKIQEEIQQPRFKVLRNKNYQKNKSIKEAYEYKIKIFYGILFKSLFLIGLITVMLNVNAMAANLTYQKALINNDIKAVEAEISYLEKTALFGMTDDEIREYVKDLGMQEAQPTQVSYIQLNSENKSVVNKSTLEKNLEDIKLGAEVVLSWFTN